VILTGGGGMEAMGGYCAVTDEVLFQLSGSDLFRKLASPNSLFVGRCVVEMVGCGSSSSSFVPFFDD